jgi:hypothetical protein
MHSRNQEIEDIIDLLVDGLFNSLREKYKPSSLKPDRIKLGMHTEFGKV